MGSSLTSHGRLHKDNTAILGSYDRRLACRVGLCRNVACWNCFPFPLFTAPRSLLCLARTALRYVRDSYVQHYR